MDIDEQSFDEKYAGKTPSEVLGFKRGDVWQNQREEELRQFLTSHSEEVAVTIGTFLARRCPILFPLSLASLELRDETVTLVHFGFYMGFLKGVGMAEDRVRLERLWKES